ncbi:hypothetical protein SNE40_005681 [Patella caerulea]|uniref:Cytochrome b5 reductase 4 n=2 Tax=Patella caerulea TaxID=87958 RepID=A0AAN8Q4Y9_PATCE
MAGNSLGIPSFPSSNSPQRIKGDGSSPARVKVALSPGRSLMDWIRLGRSGQDLTSVNGQVLDVTEEELSKHNTQEDGWLSLRGKVYNVTPYMEYHPGGIDELKRGLGKDATQLFDEIHKWVNAESMLEKCYVGRLCTSVKNQRKASTASKSSISSSKLSANGTINLTNLKPPEPAGPVPPKFDWYQTNKCITLVVSTKWSGMTSDMVIIEKTCKQLLISIFIQDYTFTVHTELEEEVTNDYIVKVQKDSGKTEIFLPKVQMEKHWSSLGKSLDNHCSYKKTSESGFRQYNSKIISVSNVNHDTKLFCLQLPEGCRMCVPVGYHVHVHHHISGIEIVRSYTSVIPSLTEDKKLCDVDDGRVVHLMIKMYTDGALTSWLNTLNIGDCIKISNFDGSFNRQYLSSSHHLIMYAAGSGFTPMIRLLYHSLKQDSTIKSVKLLFFNKRKEDILWKDQLDELAIQHKNRFEVTYVLSGEDDTWTGYTGRIRPEFVENFIPKSESDVNRLVCACGPIPFTKEVMRLAKEYGCQDSELHAFLG